MPGKPSFWLNFELFWGPLSLLLQSDSAFLFYPDMSEGQMQHTNNNVYIFLEFHIMGKYEFYEERSVASK